MADILKNNKTALRGCILYEFLQGKPVGDAYESLCKTIGNDVIEQKELKNWFNSFANGKADLEDESFDKEPLTFSDLPNKILGEIVEKLDLVSRLRTRKVSRRLRNVVDKQKAHYHSISIFTVPNEISICCDDYWADYEKFDSRCLLAYGLCSGTYSKKKIVNGNFMDIAFNDLVIMLKKPDFELEELSLLFDENADFANGKVVGLLEYLKSPIHVKDLQISNEGNEDTSTILSLFASGTLEEIELKSLCDESDASRIVKMEQWKKANIVKISGSSMHIQDCLHFKRFEIEVKSVSPQDVILLRDVFLKSTSFEYCRLNVSLSPARIAEIGKVLGEAVVQRNFEPSIIHRLPIPGSTNNYLEITAVSYGCSVERMP